MARRDSSPAVLVAGVRGEDAESGGATRLAASSPAGQGDLFGRDRGEDGPQRG